MSRQLYFFLRRYLIFFLIFPSIYYGIYPGRIVVPSFISCIIISYVIYRNKYIISFSEFDIKPFFIVLICFMFLNYLRGFTNIKMIDDKVAMVNGLLFSSFLVPLFVFLGSPLLLKNILKSFWPIGVLLCLISYFLPPDIGASQLNFQHSLEFIFMFILALPFLKKKYWLYLVLLSLWAVLYDLDRRSVAINFAVAFFISFISYKLYNKLLRKTLLCIILFCPIIFLFLGILGVYNVFENLESQSGYVLASSNGRVVTVDSRTSIYIDVLSELERKNAYILGLGGNGRTETTLSGDDLDKYGRVSTESGMLNFIQQGGAIGLVVYSLFFWGAIYKAENKSENDYVKALGLFLAFKYVFSFIEDRYGFNMVTFSNFLMLGICYNKKFRQLSNREIQNYFNLVFN